MAQSLQPSSPGVTRRSTVPRLPTTSECTAAVSNRIHDGQAEPGLSVDCRVKPGNDELSLWGFVFVGFIA
jgi:hypothetical protein